MPNLSDYSVKFGRDPRHGLYGQQSIPYFYALRNHNDVNWKPSLTGDISQYTVKCPPAGVVTPLYVRLDPDYNYKAIALKYSVVNEQPQQAGPSTFQTYENFNDASLYIPDLPGGTPYSQYIQVSLSVQGSGSTTMFGGQAIAINARTNTNGKIPLAVSCMQGYDYGYQALRCEYLIAMQSVLAFEFTNTHPTATLNVAAMMYGLKIRL